MFVKTVFLFVILTTVADIKISLVKVRANISEKNSKNLSILKRLHINLNLSVLAIAPSHLGQGIQEWTK